MLGLHVFLVVSTFLVRFSVTLHNRIKQNALKMLIQNSYLLTIY